MSARDDAGTRSAPGVVRLEQRHTPDSLRSRREAALRLRRAQVRRRRIVALGAILLVGVALGSVAAILTGGARSAPDQASGDDWRDLAYDIAAKWPGLQTKDGWYRDYIYGGGRSYCYQTICRANLGNARYGESVLGYGLIQVGLREGDQRLVNSGIKAITSVVAKPRLQKEFPTAFEGMAVAASYNLLRVQLPGNLAFVEAKRSWEAFMRRQPVLSTFFRVPDTPRYGNHFLVEAIEVLEMQRTGLRSADPRAIVGPNRDRWKTLVMRLLNTRVPDLAREGSIRVDGQPAWIHSDPPDNPLAYFGLSAGLYARAVELLGDDARQLTRRPIMTAANAAVWLMAPDGDLSYSGRSMAESWAYSGIALATEVAANRVPQGSATQASFRGVSESAIDRLRDKYGNGPNGWWILPGLRESAPPYRGIDRYNGAVAFTGLTLVTLNWALDERDASRGARRIGAIGSDRDSAVALGQGDGRFAAVRKGDVWFAVRRKSSSKRRTDLRYDFGLIALKVLGDDGKWLDIVRPRPKTSLPYDSVGPTLRSGRNIGLPYGERMRVRPGKVVIAGGYRDPKRVFLRRSVTWTYEATDCGVRLTFFAQKDEVYVYSVFVRANAARPVLRGRSLIAGRSTVRFSVRPFLMTLRGGYASSADQSLNRARLSFRAPTSGFVSITTCAR
jgi:hypothetical protein